MISLPIWLFSFCCGDVPCVVQALLPRVGADCTHIITADQVVLIDGTVCEKPESVTEVMLLVKTALQSISTAPH